MEKRIVNPWHWQQARGYVQAVEVTQPAGTLYVAGQTAIDAVGNSSTADMPTQLALALANLEHVVEAAGYDCRNIVRLTIYTTSAAELLPCFALFTEWVARHAITAAATLLEVKSLFETLTVELEATVVR